MTHFTSNFVSSGLVGRNMKRNMEFGEMFVWEASDAGIAGVVGLGGCMRALGGLCGVGLRGSITALLQLFRGQ